MKSPRSPSKRFIGLDIHKHYLVAIGVDQQKEPVFGPVRVATHQLEPWIQRELRATDAVVLEMTTNTWTVYDALLPHVSTVTVVHPPHVSLLTQVQVKTDRKAALALAQLHAVGLLRGIWVPPTDVRDLRALVAQRRKMLRLSIQAKNRLHSLLHRKHQLPPEEGGLFDPKTREWWQELPLSVLEHCCVDCDLDTLEFAQQQIEHIEACMARIAARDNRVPLLVQLVGFGMLNALSVLAAIGDISRFPSASHLVGYAGMGTRVHDSGKMHTSGRITKAGRRDLRGAVVEAAQHASRHHPHWHTEYARLEPRLGRSKAIVAIGRKLLVTVWHVLTKETADRFADPTQVACSLFAHAYRVGVGNLPDGLSAKAFVRQQLDRLGIGQELTEIPWGTKRVKLPPSARFVQTLEVASSTSARIAAT